MNIFVYDTSVPVQHTCQYASATVRLLSDSVYLQMPTFLVSCPAAVLSHCILSLYVKQGALYRRWERL